MPIPHLQALLFPVLEELADGAEHQAKEIQDRMKVKFEITSDEFSLKHKNGTRVFVNRVAWALAHLNMERGPIGHPKAITLVKKKVYRITEHGTTILKGEPSHLTINDLRR
jgi:restriction system protein